VSILGLLGWGELPRIAKAPLSFLKSVKFRDDMFIPVGSEGWYRRNLVKAEFDQLPVEAGSAVGALAVAANAAVTSQYLDLALQALKRLEQEGRHPVRCNKRCVLRRHIAGWLEPEQRSHQLSHTYSRRLGFGRCSCTGTGYEFLALLDKPSKEFIEARRCNAGDCVSRAVEDIEITIKGHRGLRKHNVRHEPVPLVGFPRLQYRRS